MRAGGPLLASEPGTGESRAGGPRPHRAEGPTPGAGLTPAMGSIVAALPQRRRSRETGSPAPAGPRQPAGSPHRTFHIRKQPYKSRFRRRLPAPYMAIPAPGWGGRRARLQTGARPPPGNRSARKPRAAEERGCCPAGWHRSLGEHPTEPGVAAVFSGAELPFAPISFAQLALLASALSLRRRHGLTAAPAAASMWRFLGAGSAPKAGTARSRKRGISGIPTACRNRPAPPAPDDSGGGLPVALDRDGSRLRAPPSCSREQGTNKQRAPGTTWPQPALTSAR